MDDWKELEKIARDNFLPYEFSTYSVHSKTVKQAWKFLDGKCVFGHAVMNNGERRWFKKEFDEETQFVDSWIQLKQLFSKADSSNASPMIS